MASACNVQFMTWNSRQPWAILCNIFITSLVWNMSRSYAWKLWHRCTDASIDPCWKLSDLREDLPVALSSSIAFPSLLQIHAPTPTRFAHGITLSIAKFFFRPRCFNAINVRNQISDPDWKQVMIYMYCVYASGLYIKDATLRSLKALIVYSRCSIGVLNCSDLSPSFWWIYM